MLAHRVKPGDKVRLSAIDASDKGPFEGKDDPAVAREAAALVARLDELQEKLYAEQKQSLLVVIQAMDTGGKDGVLHSVVGPLDSRGVHVVSFKVPSEEEKSHDFLWRSHLKAPRRGEVTFFNRSYYEDVLVVRVLDLAPQSVWKKRYDLINNFEEQLAHGGTKVVKIFLHISKDEQKERLQERLRDASKHWKFDPADLQMRGHWDDFMSAYDDALSRCSTEAAPWYVVPANRKWFRNLAVAEILVDALKELDPQTPTVSWDPSKIEIK